MTEPDGDLECARTFARMGSAYRRSGVSGGAGLWYATACEQSATADDPRWRIRLLSCSVLFFGPSVALGRAERAYQLAKVHELPAEERAWCRANLGLVRLELGELEAAQKHLRASAEALTGGPRAAALNNLALAVARADRPQALRHLASSLAHADRSHAVAILANQAAVQAEDEPHQLPDFASLAVYAAEDCEPAIIERVRFNRVRALLAEGQPLAALHEAESFLVQEKDHRDGSLVVAHWASLRREIFEALGQPCPAELLARAGFLERTSERQAWLYRLRWALCPLPLYEAPSPAGLAAR